MIGFPEKFELALRYGEGRMAQDVALSDSDKLLLDALAKQATVGPCTEPRPSMFDSVAKARWQAWSELGNRSKMEAMFMYTQAVEELAPDWWQWPPLQLGTGAYIPLATEDRGGAAASGAAAAAPGAKVAAPGAKVAHAKPEPSVPPPLLLAPNGLQPGGGWSALPEMVRARSRVRGRARARARARARLGLRALTLPQPLPPANLMAGWEEAETRRALGLHAAVEGAAVGVGVG